MVRPVVLIVLSLAAIIAQANIGSLYQAQGNCRLFTETGRQVCGLFLRYWDSHGALAQQGLPISELMSEVSETNGKTYTVQYFERAVFELHPEYANTEYEVLLTLLGRFFYMQKYPTGAPNQQPNVTPGSRLFSETGKRLGGKFLDHWRAHGGLAQQGYPISDEFMEKSDLDGKTYRVQYFERAVFELHPENAPPNDVLLSQLGTYRHMAKYGGNDPWAALRARPVKLPAVQPGQSCPATQGTIVADDFGAALGNGPVYPVGLGTEGMGRYGTQRQEGGWFYLKVLWIAAPAHKGPVLIRGGQIDGSGELRFGEGPNPPNELRLHDDNRLLTASGWSHWPTETRLRAPGCYAFQIDAQGFSSVVVFSAVIGD